MKPLDVDLRTRPVPPRWAWIPLTGVCVVTLVLGIAMQHQERVLLRAQALRDDQTRELVSPRKAPVALEQSMPYDQSAREMQQLTSSGWPAMLSVLESAPLVGVTPVALEAAPAERWLRVEVEFADYKSLLELVDALNAGEPKPVWALIQARGAEHASSGAPNTGSTAAMRASW